jgi:hypothetical protein
MTPPRPAQRAVARCPFQAAGAFAFLAAGQCRGRPAAGRGTRRLVPPFPRNPGGRNYGPHPVPPGLPAYLLRADARRIGGQEVARPASGVVGIRHGPGSWPGRKRLDRRAGIAGVPQAGASRSAPLLAAVALIARADWTAGRAVANRPTACPVAVQGAVEDGLLELAPVSAGVVHTLAGPAATGNDGQQGDHQRRYQHASHVPRFLSIKRVRRDWSSDGAWQVR